MAIARSGSHLCACRSLSHAPSPPPQFVKCGFAGDNFPTHIFPSIVGRPILRAEEKVGQVQLKDIMVGDECTAARDMHGQPRCLLCDPSAGKRRLHNAGDVVPNHERGRAAVGGHVPPLRLHLSREAEDRPHGAQDHADRGDREALVETMFEQYNFARVHCAIQAVLALQGSLTGEVVDSGDGVTHIVPVYEGYALPANIRRLDVAGRHMTEHLIKLLLLRGYTFNRSADYERRCAR
ncbi:hypothetical protein EMIHUDRAFT_449293 [Emiliania huxleyi CCMP1516]|uniref:Actin-related protein 2 n=2 Tax=Emiliania huxleyi TaxID=2903 RepID=A0A0D3KEL3_EMIH1|nr:hypothetical protein EMIHUDRAFT_449293 [Emiliania huxleyi CCMP1516]EOD34198.1 hypothetical protein EMIHUDRAFT_449293 [Emiliania huxleyi CCMP1516]|eukprot:XP_005786627.1 hypothetical protein EMIHUDRAFT_449293 [Emiliania huxleyi CCMP1516]